MAEIEHKRKNDRWQILASIISIFVGISVLIALVIGIFVSIYIRPIEACINEEKAKSVEVRLKYIPMVERHQTEIEVIKATMLSINETLKRIEKKI